MRDKGELVRVEINSGGCMKGCSRQPFRWITVALLPFHLTQGLCLGGKEANWFSSCLATAAPSDTSVCLNTVMYFPTAEANKRSIYSAL